MPSVLILDDAPELAGLVQVFLQSIGYETQLAKDADTALKLLQRESFDAILCDGKLRPRGGVAFLRQLREKDRETIVIFMADAPNLEGALEAVRAGAFDYLQKPIKPTDMSQALKRAMEAIKRRQAAGGNGAVAPVAATAAAPTASLKLLLPGESNKVQQVHRLVDRLLMAKGAILVEGEVGTGKMLLAQYFHQQGPNRDGPLVVQNLQDKDEAAVRAGLISDRGKVGSWVEQAKTGTLVLHHLEALSLGLQQELHRTLGAIQLLTRLICTAEASLEDLIAQGRFSEELYLRLCNLPLILPPLREIAEDVPAMVATFAKEVVNPSFDTGKIVFSEEALTILRRYDWPHNTQELKQVVTGLAATTRTRVIGKQQLPPAIVQAVERPELRESLQRYERQHVQSVLRVFRGDKAKAAAALGITPDQLMALASGAATSLEVLKPTTSKSSNVLLIQPDEVARFHLRELLRDFGVETTTTAHGLEGLLSLRSPSADFAAIILDEDLPLLAASAVFKLIRRQNGLVPVVLLTNRADADIRAEYGERALAAVLPKPVRAEDLWDFLGNNLHPGSN